MWIRFCCEPMHNAAFGLGGCPAQGTYMTSCCVRAGRCIVKHHVHVIVALRIKNYIYELNISPGQVDLRKESNI